MKGKFIVFEGADDLGKTTQIEMLYNYLLNKGLKVIKTREPGGTNIGSKIRDILLNSEDKVPPLSELFLFMVDKNIHYEKIIKPYLEQGFIVLSDRFQLSTLVYQHKLKGHDIETINYLHQKLVDGLWPDLTFVFHGNRLTKNIKDKYEEALGDNSHSLLNNYYYEYGLLLKDHVLINVNRERETIFKEIVSELEAMSIIPQ